VSESCAHFVKLLKRYARVELDYIPALKAASSLSPEEIKAAEAERLRGRLGNDWLVTLSDRGKKVDSHAFAKLLEKIQVKSGGKVTFLIGGPYGLHESFLKQADLTLSLSPLTFSHQIVRLVLLEQLYRGFSILSGTAYHK
jgi:23S rRNA (pseudouridine1915-N3)-methyltransferase